MYQPPFGQPMPPVSPVYAEQRAIRRDSNFVGFILIALLAAQYVVALGWQIAGSMGVLNTRFTDNTTYMVFNIVTYLLYMAVPVLLVALVTRRRQNPFPTRRVSAGNYAVALFGGMAMAVAANYVTSFIMGILVELGVPYPQFPETQSGTPVSLVLNIIATAVLPALTEEMVMRGYVLGALRRYGDKLAIVLSALFFGLVHGNVLQLPFAFLLGLVLGWLVVQTDSIWPAVLLHFGNNIMSVLLDYVEVAVGDSTMATVLTFLVLCVLGLSVLAAAFLSNKKRGEDLLRPVWNGGSSLSVSQRVTGILTAPALIVGVCVWIATLILTM